MSDGEGADGLGVIATQSYGSQRKPTSTVWEYFSRILDDDGVWKAIRNFCKKPLLANTRNGTNHLCLTLKHNQMCICNVKSIVYRLYTNVYFDSL